MALTLASGISASDRYCTVNQPPTQPPGSYYRIGDEVVQHIGFATPTPIWSQTFLQLYIARAQLGTTAASHLSAAALTYVRPEFLSATAETDPGPFETGGGGGAAAGLPTVIVVDATGGTFRNGNSIDPTPVTSYTVARDDLGAAANPADYPHLPAGTYLVGGYVDFTYVTPPSTGAVTADVNASSTGPLYPEGDLGVVGDYIPIADAGNYIFAPTKLVTVGSNTPIDLYVRSFGLDQDLSWVKWVFWAVQIVAA
jgi:hypothetical protein